MFWVNRIVANLPPLPPMTSGLGWKKTVLKLIKKNEMFRILKALGLNLHIDCRCCSHKPREQKVPDIARYYKHIVLREGVKKNTQLLGTCRLSGGGGSIHPPPANKIRKNVNNIQHARVFFCPEVSGRSITTNFFLDQNCPFQSIKVRLVYA